MDNKQKSFIVKAYDAITKMPSNWTGIKWNNNPVEMTITDDNILITKVGGAEFQDACPMRGKSRNRKEMGKIVCNHICEVWGGTMDEVTEYTQSFLKEFYQVCGIEA